MARRARAAVVKLSTTALEWRAAAVAITITESTLALVATAVLTALIAARWSIAGFACGLLPLSGTGVAGGTCPRRTERKTAQQVAQRIGFWIAHGAHSRE